MTTIDERRSRHLPWDACLNARDLGGYPCAGGGETRWDSVVRADNLALLTKAGQSAAIDYGVRTIVDLRLPREVAAHPNPFAEPGEHGIEYINISLIDPAGTPAGKFTTLANDYKSLLERFKPQIRSIMHVIAEAEEGGVIVHCMGGKDRTGIVSALLLDLAGVSRAVIGEDYALTLEYLRPQEEAWLEHGPGERAWREREVELRSSRAEVMVEVLDFLDHEYGGVEGYLLAVGVTPEEIERLRARLET